MFTLLAIAGAFYTTAIGVLWKQRQAKHCPVHSKSAGRAATLVATIAAILGTVALIEFVFEIFAPNR